MYHFLCIQILNILNLAFNIGTLFPWITDEWLSASFFFTVIWILWNNFNHFSFPLVFGLCKVELVKEIPFSSPFLLLLTTHNPCLPWAREHFYCSIYFHHSQQLLDLLLKMTPLKTTVTNPTISQRVHMLSHLG